jgi:hypothetical protein
MQKNEKDAAFVWVPGQGYAQKALVRMREKFPRPDKPMGEAWFMGETRRLYSELNGDLDRLQVTFLLEPLTEIITGNSSFGPMQEWTDWYHYLLPRLIPRSHEYFCGTLLEYLLSGFFVLYPNGIHEAPYPHFRDDVLVSLGCCLMNSERWDQGQIRSGSFLHRSCNNPAGIWGWWNASGEFSASAFFYAKYLTPDEIGPWLRSALAIKSAHWNAQMIVWLLGAYDMFIGERTQASQFEFSDRPSVQWQWSDVFKGDYSGLHHETRPAAPDFLPAENCAAILRVLDKNLTQELFFSWLDAIKKFDYLENELAELPSRFAHMYLRD